MLPLTLGERVEHAVREHQWDKAENRYEPSGISTSPHLHRARHYAAINKIVVTIDTTTFDHFGIAAYHVLDCCHPDHVSVPEDDEVILVYRDRENFPKEVIADVETLSL